MKSKISTLFVSILLLFNTSCTDLYDDNWNTFLANEYKVQTEAEIEALVASPYSVLRKALLWTTQGFRLNEITADALVIPARPTGWVDGGIYRSLHEHTWTSEHPIIRYVYQTNYEGIGLCNYILHQVDTEAIDMGSKETAYVAEVKVLRAIFYYMLCDFFGNVPLETRYDPDGRMELPKQATRAEVFNFIETEVKNNMDNLSEENGGGMYGRVNKWTAWSLLAKIYLNSEVWTGTERWQDCIDACEQVIGSGLYDLDPKQVDVFCRTNDNAKEMIFALPFKYGEVNSSAVEDFSLHYQTLCSGSQFHYFGPEQVGGEGGWHMWGNGWNGICAIPQFINTFDQDDERYQQNWLQGKQRIAQTLIDWFGIEGNNAAGKGWDGWCVLSDGRTPINYTNEVNSIAESKEDQGLRLVKFTIEQPQHIRDND